MKTPETRPGKDRLPEGWLPSEGLKLDRNERCDGPSRVVEKWLPQIPPEVVWRYNDRLPLERKLARYFDLKPEQVLATNGGDEAISYLLSALPPGTPVYLPNPTFGFYAEQAELWPVRLIKIPATATHGLNLDGIEEALQKASGGLLILVRPNNPTGESLPIPALERLLDLCCKKGLAVLLDEAYAEFAVDHFVTAIDRFPHLLILRTFSKAFGLAGLRVGYLLGAESAIARMRKRALPYNLCGLSLFLAEKALEAEGLSDMRVYVRRICENRDRLRDWLIDLGLDAPSSQANFLFLNLGTRRAELVWQYLNSRRIHVRRFTRPQLTGCLRFTIPLEIRPLREALGHVLSPDLLCLDVDGCLIDVSASFDRVVRETVRHFTAAAVPDEEIHAMRFRSGFNDDNLLAQALIRRRGFEVPLARVMEIFAGLYFGSKRRGGFHLEEKPFFRQNLLTDLGAKFKLALVTGRNRAELALAESMLGLPPSVPRITIDEVSKGKPDPEGIRLAIQKTGGRRTWMVGDNIDDILAAKAAGALPIGVGTGNRRALSEAGALIVLENINQIEELL